MLSGPTAESFDFCSACLSSKSEKGWLCFSDLSDVNFRGGWLLFCFVVGVVFISFCTFVA